MLKTEKDIIRVIEEDNFMMDILKSAQNLQLNDWWICAGFVRSKIWDVLHGFEESTSLPDIDVIYFDPSDLSEITEKKLEKDLYEIHPNVPWSVKNQARMHLSNNVAPYESAVDAIRKFPETATALGVKLSANDEVVLSAPCGIEDVLKCLVKPTAYFAADEDRMRVYRARVQSKNWTGIWHHVKLDLHKRVQVLRVDTVIFDLDGTLLNRDASVKVFIDIQYDRLRDVLGHIPKETYIKRFIELDNKGYVWKDEVYEQLISEFEIINMTWKELLEDYLQEFKRSCVPYPNLIEMLEVLKRNNIRLGMITNGFGQFQMDNFIALGIEKYFDIILVSEWEGIKKPSPKIFTSALEKLQAKASDSMYVGDHPINDVKASKNVGMISVWKKNPHWKHVEADFIIDDLLEIVSIIKYTT